VLMFSLGVEQWIVLTYFSLAFVVCVQENSKKFARVKFLNLTYMMDYWVDKSKMFIGADFLAVSDLTNPDSHFRVLLQPRVEDVTVNGRIFVLVLLVLYALSCCIASCSCCCHWCWGVVVGVLCVAGLLLMLVGCCVVVGCCCFGGGVLVMMMSLVFFPA